MTLEYKCHRFVYKCHGFDEALGIDAVVTASTLTESHRHLIQHVIPGVPFRRALMYMYMYHIGTKEHLYYYTCTCTNT